MNGLKIFYYCASFKILKIFKIKKKVFETSCYYYIFYYYIKLLLLYKILEKEIKNNLYVTMQ